MSLVVFIRGVNVGGYRTFKPTLLVKEMSEFDVVNVGAAGTFVVYAPMSQTKLRAELLKRLPFEADIMICTAAEILNLAARNAFEGEPSRSNIVKFVSILSKRPRNVPTLPISLPNENEWLLKIVAVEGKFALGLYRRQMKAISYMSQVDKKLGVKGTVRNWNTINTIMKLLNARHK